MVNETLEQETLEAAEDVEVPTDGFDPAEAPEDVVEEEAQPDIAELVERLSQIEGAAKELDTLKHDVSSQLGRIQHFQSTVDKLSQNDASTVLQSRIEQLEESNNALQELIISSDLIDDETKLAIRENALERRLKALESPASITDQQGSPEADDATVTLWNEATTEVMRQAKDLGYDPENIPASVWSEGVSTGSPIRAVQHVLDWTRQQLNETEAASKTAERKRAAGSGSASRAGSTPTLDDLVRAYGEGRNISADDKQRVMQHLGIR
jgi:DNA repair exonuclease SbcCD ATPase subunit